MELELKTNWGAAGDTGWLLVRRTGEVTTIEISDREVARGWVDEYGSVRCDSESGWIAEELLLPTNELNAEGIRVFKAAERLLRSGRSDYFYSVS